MPPYSRSKWVKHLTMTSGKRPTSRGWMHQAINGGTLTRRSSPKGGSTTLAPRRLFYMVLAKRCIICPVGNNMLAKSTYLYEGSMLASSTAGTLRWPSGLHHWRFLRSGGSA